ncbi:MAG: Glu-tRNA(Gln) amidotransferase subunit GatE [candidate division Zixibacteria bacterium]|nr:Glu-tRNA(Gln) amidotransferase subunit GatE [candidate division Zixibacteria bacterium]
MQQGMTPGDNLKRTRELVGYVPRSLATQQTYQALGFKSGLEIHQQLLTKAKLFCRCPAGRYQGPAEYDAELVRHMRPTLSEMGEYDGTALMERKTKKNIIYRIKNETACTYEVDDTPPFPINREALGIAVRIALMLKLNIVGELHITRKQYLDGSIPTGFQRTAIVGIEGTIPLTTGPVRIIQLSIEEDACREVSDSGHWRIYRTDRLGMPLIETVTYPDMKTPDAVAEAAHYLRFLNRSSGLVRTGIGAAREDVNVSITGGTRVEIKGVAHIRWIPELVHNEAFRQKALLTIKSILAERIPKPDAWNVAASEVDASGLKTDYAPILHARQLGQRIVAVTLPKFAGLMSFFTQPGHIFADELAGRLKVIACLERPNMLHSEELEPAERAAFADCVSSASSSDDAVVIVWGPPEDVTTAIETIEERCRMAMAMGVPNETRKSLPDGTTIFERVLPGPDRMYPDTDSAPIPIEQDVVDACGLDLPASVEDQMAQLGEWRIPRDTYHYLLKRRLVELIGRIAADFKCRPRFVGTLLGHTLKHVEGKFGAAQKFEPERIYELFAFAAGRKLDWAIMPGLLTTAYQFPAMPFESVLTAVGYTPISAERIAERVATLQEEFERIRTSPDPGARARWIMGQLRPDALGNMPLPALRSMIESVAAHV